MIEIHFYNTFECIGSNMFLTLTIMNFEYVVF
jgi:hypothetical protein